MHDGHSLKAARAATHVYEGAVRILDKYGNDITYKYQAHKRTSFRSRVANLITYASNRYWYWISGVSSTSSASEAR
jgi:hypothetical protein